MASGFENDGNGIRSITGDERKLIIRIKVLNFFFGVYLFWTLKAHHIESTSRGVVVAGVPQQQED